MSVHNVVFQEVFSMGKCRSQACMESIFQNKLMVNQSRERAPSKEPMTVQPRCSSWKGVLRDSIHADQARLL